MYNERDSRQPEERGDPPLQKRRHMTPFQFSFFAMIALTILGEVASHDAMRHWAYTGAFMFMVTTIFFIGTDTYKMWKVEQTRRPSRKSRS